MFKFEDIIVGTKGHQQLIDRLGDLAGAGKEVNYEEYVISEGKKQTRKVYTPMIHLEPVTEHSGREVKCRGYAIP